MERKEQTGHICRWMALGIMTAIVIVGCTIVSAYLNGATERRLSVEMQNCISGERMCMT